MEKLIQQKQQLLTAGVTLSENYIIKASLNKKIRDYSESENENNTGILINYLLGLLGISSLENDKKEMHYVVLDDFINDSLKNYSYDEIKIAFKNHIRGDYNIPAFNKLDSIIAGKVMRAYDLQKSEIIKNEKIKIRNEYGFQPMTDAEVERVMLDAVDRVKKEILETGNLEGTAHHVYDFLTESGRLDFTPEEKRAAFSIAKRELLSDAKLKADGDYQLYKKLDKTLSKIHEGANQRQKSRAKTILIINHFKN